MKRLSHDEKMKVAGVIFVFFIFAIVSLLLASPYLIVMEIPLSWQTAGLCVVPNILTVLLFAAFFWMSVRLGWDPKRRLSSADDATAEAIGKKITWGIFVIFNLPWSVSYCQFAGMPWDVLSFGLSLWVAVLTPPFCWFLLNMGGKP